MRSSLKRAGRVKLYVGSAVLVAAIVGWIAILASPGVARPAGRVLASLGSALVEEREDDLVVHVDTLSGVARGLPAYFSDPAGDTRPIAHVVTQGSDADGPWLRLRFEPGESSAGPWHLRVYPPDRKLGSALDLAVTPEAARRFGRDIAQRLEILWEEAILPEAEERLPTFLARIDPAGETEARTLVRGLAQSALRELDPLLDDLSAHVAVAVKGKFDLLARLGILWKVVRGDAEGLQREILPVAKNAARAWWKEHEAEVVQALGSAIQGRLAELKSWAGGELFQAARSELVQPILAAQRERLEEESEEILRSAADEFIRAPSGGFRVRFAAILRTHLLRKRTALLLLEPIGPQR